MHVESKHIIISWLSSIHHSPFDSKERAVHSSKLIHHTREKTTQTRSASIIIIIVVQLMQRDSFDVAAWFNMSSSLLAMRRCAAAD
jgi:hypothetical protein